MKIAGLGQPRPWEGSRDHLQYQVRGTVTCVQFASFRKLSQRLQGSPSFASLWPSPNPQTWEIWPLLSHTGDPQPVS